VYRELAGKQFWAEVTENEEFSNSFCKYDESINWEKFVEFNFGD